MNEPTTKIIAQHKVIRATSGEIASKTLDRYLNNGFSLLATESGGSEPGIFLIFQQKTKHVIQPKPEPVLEDDSEGFQPLG